MKLGWIVWRDKEDTCPEFWDHKPDYCYRCIQIVYAEILEE